MDRLEGRIRGIEEASEAAVNLPAVVVVADTVIDVSREEEKEEHS